jgi:hypothetical protein
MDRRLGSEFAGSVGCFEEENGDGGSEGSDAAPY